MELACLVMGRAGLPGPGWLGRVYFSKAPTNLTTVAPAPGEGVGLVPIINNITRQNFLAGY